MQLEDINAELAAAASSIRMETYIVAPIDSEVDLSQSTHAVNVLLLQAAEDDAAERSLSDAA